MAIPQAGFRVAGWLFDSTGAYAGTWNGTIDAPLSIDVRESLLGSVKTQ